jgi:hypothetical protein
VERTVFFHPVKRNGRTVKPEYSVIRRITWTLKKPLQGERLRFYESYDQG